MKKHCGKQFASGSNRLFLRVTKFNNSSLPYRRSNLRKIFGSFIWRWQILSTPVEQNVPLCHKQSFEMSGVNFRNYILVANPDLIALL